MMDPLLFCDRLGAFFLNPALPEPESRFQKLVPKVGVEPTRVSPHEFESCASAYSATSAQKNYSGWG